VTACAEAAQHLALDLGWPVLAVKPHGKLPLTPHGVKDATTDERTILHWFDRWPDANVGVATGAPGPSVLDVDDPRAGAVWLASLENDATPESATHRGRHLFYAGTATGTISLGFGELRQRGSYVVVPPSIHPSGDLYAWLNEPRSSTLPPVPAALVAQATSAGVGEMVERAEKVGHGERHDHLKDVAVRLLRAGITDVATIARQLRVEYETNCEPDPPARDGEFQKLAEWASSTRMASRERGRAEHREQRETTETPYLAPPPESASTAEHLAYIHRAIGLPTSVEIKSVQRFGTRLVDAMRIDLSSGQLIDFARQSDALSRGGWHKAVIGATEGAAKPPGMKDPQLLDLWRSICRVASTSRLATEAEMHAESLRELLLLCESVTGFTLATSADRFALIAALRARQRWDPFDRNALISPALITDERDSARYLRGGELWDFYRSKGAGLSGHEFPGRMAMVGLTQVPINGREPMPLDPSRGRKTNRAVLYRLAEDS